MNKKQLKEKIGEALYDLKDFSKFKHLFSKNSAKKILAKLYRTLGQIRLFLKFQDLKEIAHPINQAIKEKCLFGGECGDLVLVRPCGEEYEKKTFLGFLIGEIALSSSLSVTEDKIQCEWSHYNPGILVPELKKIIYGCGSWWTKIQSEEDFKKITNKDIENVWYVKLWKKLQN
jgi:hypothetical protein